MHKTVKKQFKWVLNISQAKITQQNRLTCRTRPFSVLSFDLFWSKTHLILQSDPSYVYNSACPIFEAFVIFSSSIKQAQHEMGVE